jgi:hypothetical protein
MLPSAYLGRKFLLLVAAFGLAGCAAMPFTAARSDSTFQAVSAGMTQEEVLRRIGPPDDKMAFPLSRTVAWDYRFQDTWGYLAIFSVTFGADGRAVSRSTYRVNDGGDHAS